MTTQVTWKTLVNAAEKEKKPEPTYQFAGANYQRTFYQPLNYNPYTGTSS